MACFFPRFHYLEWSIFVVEYFHFRNFPKISVNHILFRKTFLADRRSSDRHENSKSQMQQNGVWSVIFRKLALNCPPDSHLSVHFIPLIFFHSFFFLFLMFTKIVSELYSHIAVTQPHNAFFRQFAGVKGHLKGQYQPCQCQPLNFNIKFHILKSYRQFGNF